MSFRRSSSNNCFLLKGDYFSKIKVKQQKDDFREIVGYICIFIFFKTKIPHVYDFIKNVD